MSPVRLLQPFDQIERLLTAASPRRVLLETEVYAVLAEMGLAIPRHQFIARGAHGGGTLYPGLLGNGGGAVVKIVSSVHVHKTEVQGVVVTTGHRGEIQAAVADLQGRFPSAEGVLVAEFIPHARSALGHELVLGGRQDAAFGPVVSLGPGGTGVEEFVGALRSGMAPTLGMVGESSDAAWVGPFLDQSWTWRWMSGGIRGLEPVISRSEMEKWLTAMGALLREFSDGGRRAWTIEELECNPLVVSGGRLVPLDGLLRFRPSVPIESLPPRSRGSLNRLMNPRRVAVVGVGGERSVGRIILRNILEGGFSRGKITVVKLGITELEGVACVPAIGALAVDTMIIATPAQAVPSLIKEAVAGKISGVVVISGGVGEKQGTEPLEREVAEVIREGRKNGGPLAVCGANSLGVWSRHAKFNTFFIPSRKMPAFAPRSRWKRGVGFVSQSGAFIISTMSRLGWLNPQYAVSAGNQVDVTLGEYVEFLAEDPRVEVIAVYAEGIRAGDGRRLAEAVRLARRHKKWVVVYKAGRTPAGAEAVRGHTASIAGEYPVFRAAMESAGAWVVESFDDFDDGLRLAVAWPPESCGEGRAMVITNAGFEAAGTADGLDRKAALTCPSLDASTRRAVEDALTKQGLEKIIDAKNPLDLTPIANDQTYLEVLRAALSSATVDLVLLSVVPMTAALHTLPAGEGHGEDFRIESLVTKLGREVRRLKKPVVACVSAGALYDPYAKAIEDEGIPMFRNVDRAIRMVSSYVKMSRGPGVSA